VPKKADNVVPILSTEDLIREGARLKAEIDSAQARLREVNCALFMAAEFAPGKKTAYLVGAGYRVKLQARENGHVDQERVVQLRPHLGEAFDQIFRVEYKPDRKALDSYLQHGEPETIAGLNWAVEIKPGAPQVVYEELREGA